MLINSEASYKSMHLNAKPVLFPLCIAKWHDAAVQTMKNSMIKGITTTTATTTITIIIIQLNSSPFAQIAPRVS